MHDEGACPLFSSAFWQRGCAGELCGRWAERLGEEREEEEKEKEEEERRLREEREKEKKEKEEEEKERAAAPAPQACRAAGEVAPSPGPRHISAGLEWLLQPRL